jgi:hypothetical protein
MSRWKSASLNSDNILKYHIHEYRNISIGEILNFIFRADPKSNIATTTRHNFNIRTPYWKMNEYEIQDGFHYKTQIQYKTTILDND